MKPLHTAVVFALALFLAAVSWASEPALHDANSWEFDPADDAFTSDALLDLRYLNEAESGQTGFIGLSDDGMSFVRGDGEPIRFWSVIVRVDLGAAGFSQQEVEQAYRFMAKRGVNMARVFLMIPDHTEGASIFDVDDAQIDRLHQHIAAAKRNGIYVTVSPYWPFEPAPESWELEGVPAGTSPWGLLFFDDRFQEAYKSWIREIYTRENPYTGLALVDDPTVAIILSLNEDSLLFWTLDRIPPTQRKNLSALFGDWLVEKYGSLSAASAAWEGATMPEDDFENGRVGLHLTYELVVEPRENPVRLNDQTQFFAETQRGFYAEVRDYVRDELGAKQLMSDSNWRPGDLARQNDLERWTYSGSEVLSLNRYFTGIHNGPFNGWKIDPGDRYTNVSALRNPDGMPVAVKQPLGMPFILTEAAWVAPTLYQSEGPLVQAAYMSLTGVDSTFWFPIRAPQWQDDPRHIDGNYFKWNGRAPMQAGQYPAAALAFRLGLIAEADRPAVVERRTLASLFARVPAALTEGTPFDPNRDVDRDSALGAAELDVNPLAFFVGPVLAEYDTEADALETVDLGSFIDGGRVSSLTGELELDTVTGLFTMDAPAAQGVAGFLAEAGGVFELSDVTIESDNDYATISVVAVDGLPLADSQQVLIQVGTYSRLDGWTAEHDPDAAETEAEIAAGTELLTLRTVGSPPWRIANTQATIVLMNLNLTRATALDANGYATGEVTFERAGRNLVIELPPDTMYVLLQ